ncbi:MAG: hypothetical protein GY772_27120 [bacterium]|nr:hypothetical protein [bacterium]
MIALLHRLFGPRPVYLYRTPPPPPPRVHVPIVTRLSATDRARLAEAAADLRSCRRKSPATRTRNERRARALVLAVLTAAEVTP